MPVRHPQDMLRSTSRPPAARRRLWRIVGPALAAIIMLMPALVWLFGIGTPQFMVFPRPFDSGLWKTADRLDDARCRMVGDLTHRIGLVGRTADEVRELLGPPDEDLQGEPTIYVLCPSTTDTFIMEMTWQRSRVVSVKVRDT